MPNRIIKESLCTSESISSLTDFEFRLWIGLITQADDAGRGDARPAIIKGRIFPLRERVTAKDIDSALHGLAAKGCVSLYEIGGKPYFLFPTWGKHQRIRDVKTKFPAPKDFENNEQDDNVCDNLPQLAADCGYNPIQSNPNTESESNPSVCTPAHAQGDTQKQRKRFVKPSVDQIREYCQERRNSVDPEKFFDFYESKGWVIGKEPMKDWKACVRTWEKSENESKKSEVPRVGELGNSFDTDDFFEAALRKSTGNI